jgi:hypothetical protein
MKQLVQCLIDWIDQLHASGQAASAVRALASETMKRADSPQPDQRQFDALDLAQAADTTKTWDYDLAKQWLNRANMPKFMDARREDLCTFFRDKGHHAVIIPQKSDTAGRHRAYWYLAVQPLSSEANGKALVPPTSETSAAEIESPVNPPGELVYDYSGPDDLRLGPLGWILLGRQGNTPTKSAWGLIWAGIVMAVALLFMLCVVLLWAMTRLQRPVTAGDIASLAMLFMTGALAWRFLARPLIWLMEDRIIPAPELLAGFREDSCQLEMPKEGNARYIRLVRYGGVCPVCAGQMELRYGAGSDGRRLFGCCSEAPQEHVFSFDRVTRRGKRVRTRE